MTEAEMIDEAKKAFIKRGFWPNDVMWACWLDAWKQSALIQRESCAKLADQLAWADSKGVASAIRARGQE